MVQDAWNAVGLMSGTSMDGVDAAILVTDGENFALPGPGITVPYDDDFRQALRGVLGCGGDVTTVEATLTRYHVRAVKQLLALPGTPDAIDVIGFHGHTIYHDPARGVTRQIGDAALLACQTAIDVVHDFRSADVAAGGQGAPLAPVYHRVLARDIERPTAILNIGGVANVTWISDDSTELVAFDTGPGNALIDDWIARDGRSRFDDGGRIAASGNSDPGRLEHLLSHPYFDAPWPKSLDRDDFGSFAAAVLAGMSPGDGAALLTEFTVESVARAVDRLPGMPRRWIVAGGGRHNDWLMERLAQRLRSTLIPSDALGWNGDAIEAQAFAYIAVRSRLDLPISFPGTTGVRRAMSGGRTVSAR